MGEVAAGLQRSAGVDLRCNVTVEALESGGRRFRAATLSDGTTVEAGLPRFWTLDEITAHATGEIRSFGGLQARWVAALPIPPGLDVSGQTGGRYYRDITIKRETEWIFTGRRPVYEMLTPDGPTYIMQAYSHIVDDSLTLDSLPGLGDRLHLPQGWRYRVRTPDRDLTLRTVAGGARVLQDELQNTYMQLTAG